MSLPGTLLETLVGLIKNAFNRDSLSQLVRFKLGADMYKEWVPAGNTFNTDVFNLVTTLEREGLLATFLHHLCTARLDLQAQLEEVRSALDNTSTTANDNATVITDNVAGVAQQMALPPVRAIILQSRDVLTRLTSRISLLCSYKALHDQLHQAKMSFRGLDNSAKQMASDPMAVSDFGQSVMAMETITNKMESALQNWPPASTEVRPDEADWLERFSSAVKIARAAADSGEHVPARQSVQGIRSVLRTEPSRIDARLSRTAGEIDLSTLKEIFLSAAAIPDLKTQSATLRQGSTATEQLLRQLKAQTNQHANWQAIDRSLAGADEIMRSLTPDEPWDFDALWKGIKEGISILIALESESPWAQKIDSFIKRIDTARNAQNWPALRMDFERFRQEATVQFFVVDTQLLNLAGKVNTIGEPLHQLLNQL